MFLCNCGLMTTLSLHAFWTVGMKKGKLCAAKSYNALASYRHRHCVINRHLTPNGIFKAAWITFPSITMCSTPSPLSQFSLSSSSFLFLSFPLPPPSLLSFSVSLHLCLSPAFLPSPSLKQITHVKNRAMCFMIVVAPSYRQSAIPSLQTWWNHNDSLALFRMVVLYTLEGAISQLQCPNKWT